MSLIVNGTTIPETGTVKFNGTSLSKIIYNGVTVWERWVKKTGTHYTASLAFELGSDYTITSGTFSAVKPTKLHLNWSFGARDWDNISHTVIIQGLTVSGSWVDLWSGTKKLNGTIEDNWYINETVSVSVSEAITQLRSHTSGRFWNHTQTIKITEWYQKG